MCATTADPGRGAAPSRRANLLAASLLGASLLAGAATPALAQVAINGTSVGSTYSVPAAGVTATTDEYVGQGTSGTLTQTQGTNNASAYQVYIGDDLGMGYVTGTYNLSGGTLLAAGEQLGLNSGEGDFNQTGGTNVVTNLSLVGQFGATQPQSSASYTLGGGTLTAGSIAVGTGRATDNSSFAFNGGAADFGSLALATGGTVTASGNEVLDTSGNLTAGNEIYAITQTGGSNTVAGSLELGVAGGILGTVGGGSFFAPNSGTYTLKGGSISADAASIGLAGAGSVVQDGGSVTLTAPSGSGSSVTLSDGSTQGVGGLVLGAGATGSGSYALHGGTLTAPGNVIVDSNGSFAFDGGSLITDGLTIAGGTVTASGNEQFTGTGPAAAVTTYQTAGSNTVAAGALILAGGTGTQTYLLEGGTVSAQTETISAGVNGFAQSGGSNTASTLTIAGSGLNGAGYQLSGGTLNAGSIAVAQTGSLALYPGGSLDFGQMTIAGSVQALSNEVLDSAGQTHASYGVTQTGGTNTTTQGALELGAAAGNTGTYSLASGTVTAQAEVIGLAGTGVFTQTGGTNSLSGALPNVFVTLSTGATVAQGTLSIGFAPGSSGTYNLQGGSLSGAATVTAYGTFNLTGGSGGTVTNDGSFVESTAGSLASLTNNAAASVAGTLTVSTTVANAGTLVLAGGTVSTAGGLANTGTITGTGTISGGGGFTNSGTLVQTGAMTLSSTGTNDNTGEIDLLAGTTAPLQIAAGTTLANDGLIKLNGGAIGGGGILENSSGVIGGTGRIGAATFRNAGTLTADSGLTQVSGLFINSGLVEMTGPAALLTGSVLNNFGTIEGAGRISAAINDQGGTIQALGGTLVLGGAVSTTKPTTLLTAAGTKILAAAGMGGNIGTISLAGGSFDNGGHSLTNNGTIAGYGTFASGGLTNNGTVLIAGGTATVSGAVTNAAGGTITIDHASAVFDGPVVNNGTLHTVLGTASYAGTFTNNGTVISDPSTQTFAGDLVEGSTGVIQASAGDSYIVEGGFLNHSTQASSWNTTGASLDFAAGGVSSTHSLLLAGLDRGATAAGYTNNFAWGDLAIDSGQSVALGAGIDSTGLAFYLYSLGGALVSGSNITNISGNGFDMYYDPFAAGNAYLGGLTYALAGGGSLIADSGAPVPEPASLALLAVGLLALGAARRSA